MVHMAGAHGDDTTGHADAPMHVTLTTDHVTADAAGPLTDALHAASVAVEYRAFLPVRGEEQHPWGVLLLAASGPPRPLARLVGPATAPAGVPPALAAALGVEARSALAMLQLKADGVFVSIRGRDIIDITQALDALPTQLARLDALLAIRPLRSVVGLGPRDNSLVCRIPGILCELLAGPFVAALVVDSLDSRWYGYLNFR